MPALISPRDAAAAAEPHLKASYGEAEFEVWQGRVTVVGETWWAWVVTVRWDRSIAGPVGRPLNHTEGPPVMFGLGPTFVDKRNGSVHPTGSGTSLRRLERELGHRPWWNFWGPTSIFDSRLYYDGPATSDAR